MRDLNEIFHRVGIYVALEKNYWGRWQWEVRRWPKPHMSMDDVLVTLELRRGSEDYIQTNPQIDAIQNCDAVFVRCSICYDEWIIQYFREWDVLDCHHVPVDPYEPSICRKCLASAENTEFPSLEDVVNP